MIVSWRIINDFVVKKKKNTALLFLYGKTKFIPHCKSIHFLILSFSQVFVNKGVMEEEEEEQDTHL